MLMQSQEFLCNKLKQKQERNEKQFEQKFLYHYTSLEALMSILESKTLWFGSKFGMNDKMECQLLVDNLKQAIIKIPIENKEKNECLKKFDQIRDDTIFIFSMTTEEDDVSHWDRYAAQGRGVCIKLDIKELTKLELIYKLMFMSKIDYCGDKGHDYYLNIIKKYIEYGELDFYETGFMEIDDVIRNLYAAASQYKHKSFKSEKEGRLVFFNVYKENEKFIFKNDLIKRLSVINLEKTVGTISVDLQELIKEIIIGPCSNQNIRDLEFYLQSLNLQKLTKKIRLSHCPFIK